MSILVYLSIIALMVSCSKDTSVLKDQGYAEDAGVISYLALGDSYTIGTAIGSEKAYAGQLKDSLNYRSYIDSVSMEIIAQNGWTTSNLLNALTIAQPDSNFDLVSMLIGVNNQYQKRLLSEYRAEFRRLLEWSIALADQDAARVFVFSIPDWGVTPAGQGNSSQIASEIDQFNEINKQISDSLKVSYYDITPLSRTAANNLDLVANDGLHFSSKMHTLWLQEHLEKILDQVN